MSGRELDGVHRQPPIDFGRKAGQFLRNFDRIRGLGVQMTQRLGQLGEFMRGAFPAFR